jgi:hypothetical protein
MNPLRTLFLAAAFVGPGVAAAQARLQTPVDVTVVNKLAQPVPTVDRSAAQPVTGYCQAAFSQLGCTLYTVPAGKRLVVETVSYFLTVELQNQITRLSYGKRFDEPMAIAPGLYPVNPVLQSTNATLNSKRYAGSQSLRFHVDQGDTLDAQFGSDGGGNYVQQVGFGGYLVDR